MFDHITAAAGAGDAGSPSACRGELAPAACNAALRARTDPIEAA
jgi:hypothetical protein